MNAQQAHQVEEDQVVPVWFPPQEPDLPLPQQSEMLPIDRTMSFGRQASNSNPFAQQQQQQQARAATSPMRLSSPLQPQTPRLMSVSFSPRQGRTRELHPEDSTSPFVGILSAIRPQQQTSRSSPTAPSGSAYPLHPQAPRLRSLVVPPSHRTKELCPQQNTLAFVRNVSSPQQQQQSSRPSPTTAPGSAPSMMRGSGSPLQPPAPRPVAHVAPPTKGKKRKFADVDNEDEVYIRAPHDAEPRMKKQVTHAAFYLRPLRPCVFLQH